MTHAYETEDDEVESSTEEESGDGYDQYSAEELLACRYRWGMEVPGEDSQLLEAQPDSHETWEVRFAIECVLECDKAEGKERELVDFYKYLERFL